MRAVRYLVAPTYLLLSIVRIDAAATASNATNLQLTITPMQCSIEKTHDGTKELTRITPISCQKYVNIHQEQKGLSALSGQR